MSTTLALLIAGALIGLAIAYSGARTARATRKMRATIRRWSRTRLTITQAPRPKTKTRRRKGSRR